MPEIDDVVSGESVEAVWGNQMRDRSLQRYVDATERDVLNPTPEEGDLGYLQNVEEITFFDGVGWRTIVTQADAGFPWLSKAGDTMLGALQFNDQLLQQHNGGDEWEQTVSGAGNWRLRENLFWGAETILHFAADPAGTGFSWMRVPDAGFQFRQPGGTNFPAKFEPDGRYSVGNIPESGQDIPGVDLASMTYTQASFNASITTFSTRSASILESQLNPHFRLSSADSDTNPDKRIGIADDFFQSASGSDLAAALSGGWWNFHRIASTLAIKEDIFPWNPALPMPATIPGGKQAGGAGATPFTPENLMDLTPVTYNLTPDHITARESDPGELLGYIAEDVNAKAPWLLNESGEAMDREKFNMAILELIRDVRDRLEVLEP